MPLLALTVSACLGSGTASAPSGALSIRVRTLSPASLGDSLSGRISLISRRYTLRCGPAGGSLPQPKAACVAVADYLAHPPRISTCIPPLGGRLTPAATVTGTYGGHPIHVHLDAGSSWCGQSTAIMHDDWVLSDFPCVTQVVSAPGDSARNVCERVQGSHGSRG